MKAFFLGECVKNGYFAYYAITYSTITLLPIEKPQKSPKIDPFKMQEYQGFQRCFESLEYQGFQRYALRYRNNKGFKGMSET